jgi:excisionase family DNA binding protein
MTQKLLTIREVSDILRLAPATIRQWCWLKKIAYVKVGHRVRIPQSAVDALTRNVIPAKQTEKEEHGH